MAKLNDFLATLVRSAIAEWSACDATLVELGQRSQESINGKMAQAWDYIMSRLVACECTCDSVFNTMIKFLGKASSAGQLQKVQELLAGIKVLSEKTMTDKLMPIVSDKTSAQLFEGFQNWEKVLDSIDGVAANLNAIIRETSPTCQMPSGVLTSAEKVEHI